MCEKSRLEYKSKLQKIKTEFKDRNFEILEHFVVGVKRKKTRLKLKCSLDSNIWEADYSKIKSGRGCPECKKLSLSTLRMSPKVGESIYENRKDLLIYFKNINDSKNYKPNSREFIDVICPNCKYESSIKIFNLTSNNKFSCPICSDGISLPEKFISNLLKSIDIAFEKGKKFKWSNGKIYDFYIPSLNLIIETHGLQHYTNNGFNGKSDLNYEIHNDKYKKQLATSNGILDYIEIDCRYSELDFLKHSVSNALFNIVDVEKLDFYTIWCKCQSSIIADICDAWNQKNDNDTAKDIAKNLKLSKTTIIKYLKIGDGIGICKYNPIDELKKSLFKHKDSKRKIVYS